MSTASRFRQSHLPKQPGEQGRLKVVQGPDYGTVFVLTGAKVVVGRGEDCDVMLGDLKASRKHAELLFGYGGWTLRDAGSANGVIHNNKNTMTVLLKNGDTITLGETILEFFGADASPAALMAPPRAFSQTGPGNEAAFEAQRARVRALGKSQRAPAAPGAKASGGGMRLILVGGGVAACLYLMFGTQDDAKPAKKKSSKAGESRDLASFLPDPGQPKELNLQADQFFKAGFREYRERNYLRAKTSFENVLQVSPNHALARAYLDHCRQGIQEEVKTHQENAKKDAAIGKLKSAKAHYEAILRLLAKDPTDPAFAEAKEGLEQVEKSAKEGAGT